MSKIARVGDSVARAGENTPTVNPCTPAPPHPGQQLAVDIESETDIKLDWLQECMLQVLRV